MAEIEVPAPLTLETLPEGDYAIVEVLGHRTLVGRVREVERFGTKLLQVEPLFRESMLGGVLIGGGRIYQFTPCSAPAAWQRRPQYEYALPESVRDAMPALALPAPPPAFEPEFLSTSVRCGHANIAQHDHGPTVCADCGEHIF